MSVARSTGALLGTNESTGVTIAAGATTDGSEVDLLADATSMGTVFVYVSWTAAAALTGSVRVHLKRNRVSGQTFPEANQGVIEFPVQYGGKKYLGAFPASRYMQASFENRSSGSLTNCAILYELEKVS